MTSAIRTQYRADMAAFKEAEALGQNYRSGQMIGYSERARARYHKEQGVTGWARCDAIPLTFRAPPDKENSLQCDASHLSRCPKCWR